MGWPQNSFRTLSQLKKNSPVGSQKVKNDPKIKSKLKELQKINVQLPYPKKSPLGPQILKKMTPKLSQNQMSKLKKRKQIKLFALYK